MGIVILNVEWFDAVQECRIIREQKHHNTNAADLIKKNPITRLPQIIFNNDHLGL